MAETPNRTALDVMAELDAGNGEPFDMMIVRVQRETDPARNRYLQVKNTLESKTPTSLKAGVSA